jgi:hypothetical protein
MTADLSADTVEIPNRPAELDPATPAEPDIEATYERFLELGMCDGLPFIPPTEERVERMLAHTDRAPDDVIGRVPPRMGVATVAKIAVNCVMAGCRPSYLPVVITAVEAALDPAANLRAALTTTYVSWPLIVVNGPVRNELGINCSWGLLSSGFHANDTIGRALTLVWSNIGGSKPGLTEMKPQGSLLRHTPVIGEFEEESAWEPLHVERGYAPDTSTVTVFADYGIPDFMYGQAFGHPTFELYRFARGIASITNHGAAVGGIGSEPLLLFNPAHSKELGDDGWTKLDVKKYFYENARTRREDLLAAPSNPRVPEDVRQNTRVIHTDGLPKWAQEMIDSPYVVHEWIPVVKGPEEFTIVVAGGPAPQAGKLLYFKGHCMGERSVTRPISDRGGRPVRTLDELQRGGR